MADRRRYQRGRSTPAPLSHLVPEVAEQPFPQELEAPVKQGKAAGIRQAGQQPQLQAGRTVPESWTCLRQFPPGVAIDHFDLPAARVGQNHPRRPPLSLSVSVQSR